jgi:hypothetical protein
LLNAFAVAYDLTRRVLHHNHLQAKALFLGHVLKWCPDTVRKIAHPNPAELEVHAIGLEVSVGLIEVVQTRQGDEHLKQESHADHQEDLAADGDVLEPDHGMLLYFLSFPDRQVSFKRILARETGARRQRGHSVTNAFLCFSRKFDPDL